MSRQNRWEPLVRVNPQAPNEMVRALARDDEQISDQLRRQPKEMWWNRVYTVIVYRSEEGNVAALSIRRNDRRPESDWRDLQRIKNQLGGEHSEAVNLHPDEDRLVDEANHTWLWFARPGEHFPMGFQTRRVGTPAQARAIGAQQRAGDTRVVAQAPDGS